MNKLATLLAVTASLAIATPVFACPNMDHDQATATAKADPKPADAKAPAKADAKKPEAKEAAKATAKAAPSKDKSTPKKPDKVSSK